MKKEKQANSSSPCKQFSFCQPKQHFCTILFYRCAKFPVDFYFLFLSQCAKKKKCQISNCCRNPKDCSKPFYNFHSDIFYFLFMCIKRHFPGQIFFFQIPFLCFYLFYKIFRIFTPDMISHENRIFPFIFFKSFFSLENLFHRLPEFLLYRQSPISCKGCFPPRLFPLFHTIHLLFSVFFIIKRIDSQSFHRSILILFFHPFF